MKIPQLSSKLFWTIAIILHALCFSQALHTGSIYLVDSIGKKIKVVNEVAKAIGLKNLKAEHIRAEQVAGKFDFVISRAVTQLKDFYPWVKGKFNKESKNTLLNGILYLKGGDLENEIAESGLTVRQFQLKKYFEEEFFETKQVIYVKG